MLAQRDLPREHRILARVLAGERMRDVGKHFGISAERVRQIVKRLEEESGIKFKRHRLGDVFPESIRQRAIRAGLNPATVQHRVIRGEPEELLFGPPRRRNGPDPTKKAKAEKLMREQVVMLAKKLGHSPRIREYREEYGKHPPFQFYFKNWNNVMRMAGLEPISLGSPGRVPKTTYFVPPRRRRSR